MNILITDINGRFPIVLDDYRFFDAAYRSAIHALMHALTKHNNVILFGLELTNNGGVNFTISEGAVVLDGELLNVNETTVDIPLGKIAVIIKNELFDPNGLKKFGDDQLHNTYKIIQGVVDIIDYVTISPDVISVNNTARIDNINWETAFSKNTAFNKNFGSTTGTVPDINADLTENQILETDANKKLITSAKKSAHNKDFANKTETLTGTSETKPINPKRLQNHEQWQEVSSSSNWDVSNIYVRKLTNGLIQLIGNYEVKGIGRVNPVFILPEGYRPLKEIRFSHFYYPNKYTTIQTDGEVIASDDNYNGYINEIFTVN